MYAESIVHNQRRVEYFINKIIIECREDGDEVLNEKEKKEKSSLKMIVYKHKLSFLLLLLFVKIINRRYEFSILERFFKTIKVICAQLISIRCRKTQYCCSIYSRFSIRILLLAFLYQVNS